MTQYYEPMTDMSGNPNLNEDRNKMSLAVDQVVAELSENFSSDIKIYDFGFYRMGEFTNGGFESDWSKVIIGLDEEKVCLLIGKESDTYGIYTKFWTKVHFPENIHGDCFDESFENYCQSEVNKSMEINYDNLGRGFNVAVDAQILGVSKLVSLMNERLECCNSSLNVAKFVQSENQIYVWDDNDFESYHQLRIPPRYPLPGESSTFITNPFFASENSKEYKWKFVSRNSTDAIEIQNGEMGNIYFDSTLLAVTPDTITTPNEIIDISNIDLFKLSASSGGVDRTAISVQLPEGGQCNGDTLNIYGANQQIFDIAIVSVLNSAGDIPDFNINYGEVANSISSIYAPAGVSFGKIDFFDEVISYDLNGDDSVSVFPNVGAFSAEVNIAIDYIQDSSTYINNYDGIILLFGRTKIAYLGTTPKRNSFGKWPNFTQIGVVYMGNLNPPANIAYKTISHELGHGVFGLAHPWDRYNYPLPVFRRNCGLADWCSETDPSNLIGYNPNGLSLKRIYQCYRIHTQQ